MHFRKIIVMFLMFTYIFSVAAPTVLAQPQVTGLAAAVIDSKSGEIIFSKDGDTPLPPASITKILTAILALENSKLTDKVKASKNPSLVEPSMIGIKEGEILTMETLMYSLMIKSANDAGVAIAEHVSGSVPEFVKLMNDKARELGATNSNFVNPHGLHDPNHYTTANDMALIAIHAMEKPELREIVKLKYKVIPRDDDTAVKWLPNSNKMLWRYEGANGLKTGYTKHAKQCLVASAARGDQEFIAVILGSIGNNVWIDAQNLLDYGFNNYKTVKYKNANVPVKTVEVSKGTESVTLLTGNDFYYTLPKDKTGPVTETVKLNDSITAPITKGQVLGQIVVSVSGKEAGTVELIADKDVPVKKFVIKDKFPFNPMLAGTILLGFFVVWNVRKRRRRRRKKYWIHRNSIR